ncbi:MAG: glycosyltransferase [Chromatiaceae bacterium]|nr:glycosyltransferase [Chromatiaceae bacterium]
MHLISIIMPAYNAKPWIGDAIASVLAQGWTHWELIVVDDGSSDATAGAVEAVDDARVRLVRQHHQGATAARNRGLSDARGSYIQYLDADDLLAPQKLEAQLRALEQGPVGAVASCAWARFQAFPGEHPPVPEPVWTVSDPVDWLVTSLAGGGMMQTAAWLTPRAVVDSVGPWDERLTLHDDGEYFSRILLKASRNLFVPQALVHYRDLNDGLSRRRSAAAARSSLEVSRARERHLRAVRDDEMVRRAIATQYAQVAYEFAATYPDVSRQALRDLKRVNAQPHPVIGGGMFRALSRLVGFNATMALQQLMKSLPA